MHTRKDGKQGGGRISAEIEPMYSIPRPVAQTKQMSFSGGAGVILRVSPRRAPGTSPASLK
jgi:hypothetical protein